MDGRHPLLPERAGFLKESYRIDEASCGVVVATVFKTCFSARDVFGSTLRDLSTNNKVLVRLTIVTKNV